jgi:pimeloyl-ACP methyl ester carboxylesterase
MSTTLNPRTEIRAFRISIPDGQIDDLRRRIAATRWPTREIVEDRSQGVQLATLRQLAHYWTTEYDWRRCEARLNALPQFTSEAVAVPVAFTTFPDEIFAAPRSWVETAYPGLAYFNEVDRGGHFAAWEEPELFSTEVRAAFRSLR